MRNHPHRSSPGFTRVESPAVSDRQRAAFTLVELLVVVAIIVALLAMLLPSMGRAYSVTLRTTCAANQKNWAIATLAYAADNMVALPYNGNAVPGFSPIGGQHVSWNSTIVQQWWSNYLLPNVGAAPKNDEHDVLNCPTQTWHQINDRNWDPERGVWIAGGGGLVGYFWLPARNPTNINYTPAGDGWVSKTRIGGPDSRAPIMSDMKQYSTSGSSWYYGGGTYSSHARTSTGEPEGSNFAFEDAHVKWYDSDTSGNASPTDPDDIIKLGATMGGWNFYYKIPLQ